MRPADYFYRLMSFDPFVTFINDENRARNLAILSQLLNAFHRIGAQPPLYCPLTL
jgi:hypothetical protein